MSGEILKFEFFRFYGKTLQLILAIYHMVGGKCDGQPQVLELVFDSIGVVSVKCAKDGASLSFELGDASECDLGVYGKFKRYVLEDNTVVSAMVGEKVVEISQVYSEVQGEYIGILMGFESGGRLVIMNLGDDIFVSGEVAPQVAESEGVVFVKVVS